MFFRTFSSLDEISQLIDLLASVLQHHRQRAAHAADVTADAAAASVAHLSCDDTLLLLYHWSSVDQASTACVEFCDVARRVLCVAGKLTSSDRQERDDDVTSTARHDDSADKTSDKTRKFDLLLSSGDTRVAKVWPALAQTLKTDSALRDSLVQLFDVVTEMFYRHVVSSVSHDVTAQRAFVLCVDWSLQLVTLLLSDAVSAVPAAAASASPVPAASASASPVPAASVVLPALRLLECCADAVDRLMPCHSAATAAAASSSSPAAAAVGASVARWAALAQALRGRCRQLVSRCRDDDSRIADTLRVVCLRLQASLSGTYGSVHVY